MKKPATTFATALFLSAALCMSVFGGSEKSEKSEAPQPPFMESGKGYVEILQNLSLDPPGKKFFILSQSYLTLLDEDENNFYVITRLKEGSCSCVIPKYAKFTSIMDISENRDSIYFRGSIEVKTCPFNLEKGEELPIQGERDGKWEIMVTRKGKNFSVFIPKDLENTKFREKSSFAEFADIQKSKGLEYFQGGWMKSEEVGKIREKKRLEEEKTELKKEELFKAADNGYIVLKDGTVLKGVRKGSDKRNVYFESNGRERWVSPFDIKDLSAEQMKGEGFYKEAETLFFKAAESRAVSQGEAMRNAEKALVFLEKASETGLHMQDRISDLSQKLNEFICNVQDYLLQNGLVLYEYVVLPQNVLNYHLDSGHILLRKKFWVDPDQICAKCEGSGKNICPGCAGTGSVKKNCTKCKDGRVTCQICGGKGEKQCWICKGSGTLMKKCPTCYGKGSIIDYDSFGGYGYGYLGGFSNQIVISSNGGPIIYSGYQSSCGRGGGWGGVGCGGWGGGISVQTCPVCDGSGQVERRCWNCSGRGEVPCTETQICKFCQGKGFSMEVCGECKGLKKVECADCKGKGYHGETQPFVEKSSPPPNGIISPNSPLAVPTY